MILPLITLTTDFGYAAPYVAAMKGVISSINPAARILDLTHAIRRHDLRHAAYFLSTAIPYFPVGSVHVCVIDPGVGSDRAAIYTEVDGRHLLGPDNGIFTGLWRAASRSPVVRKLTEPRFWRPTVSSTFHGRDIFAPVAAHLSRGVSPATLGPILEHPVQLAVRDPVYGPRRCEGEVQFIDDFGNIITNLAADRLPALPMRARLGSLPPQQWPWVRTYADAAPGTIVTLFSSDGFLEIAIVQGNAAQTLGVQVGDPVVLECDGAGV